MLLRWRVDTFGIIDDLTLYREPLTAACARDVYGLTYADLEAGMASEEYLAIANGRFCVVVEKAPVRDGNGLCLVALGGEGLEDWLEPLLAMLEGLARDQGCRSILMRGRLGWQRRLTKHGWAVHAVVLQKQID